MKIRELYPDVITEDTSYEYKAVLNPDSPIKWAKTLIGYANDKGGTVFVGVSNDGEAFGIDLEEVDKTKLLISRINDRHIFPHIKISYMMRSVDSKAEHFVLAVKVAPADSVIRYREGDYNETVFIKGDGNATPATPEEIISLSKRKYGVDNETSEVAYTDNQWSEYLNLCKEYRQDKSAPTIKELQNEEIVSKDGYAKSGFIMFSDNYSEDDTMICCRLWKGKNKTGIVLDSNRFRGSIANVFTNALNFIERNTKTGWVKTENGGRNEIRSYPKEAVREALVNAIAYRDYSISGTQIDVDIYSDRIEIAACLDVANLMERGGTGFQTMIESYKACPDEIQPVVSIYPGFLNLKLFDRLYRDEVIELDLEGLTDGEKVLAILKMEGPKPIKELQMSLNYRSRSQFLNEVINPLMKSGEIYRDGKPKSPTALIKIKR